MRSATIVPLARTGTALQFSVTFTGGTLTRPVIEQYDDLHQARDDADRWTDGDGLPLPCRRHP